MMKSRDLPNRNSLVALLCFIGCCCPLSTIYWLCNIFGDRMPVSLSIENRIPNPISATVRRMNSNHDATYSFTIRPHETWFHSEDWYTNETSYQVKVSRKGQILCTWDSGIGSHGFRLYFDQSNQLRNQYPADQPKERDYRLH